MSSGDFSRLAEAYDKGRKPYPCRIILECLALVPPRAKILDLGCGTGIAARQMADEDAKVIGLDPSLSMLKKAVARATPIVSYAQGMADAMPFAGGSFGLVAAFGSFHWFGSPESLREVRRVLSFSGVFVAVNRKHAVRDILESALGRYLRNPKAGYRPLEWLGCMGFRTEQKVLHAVEEYSMDEFLWHMQSTSHWSAVEGRERRAAIAALGDQFDARAENGILKREVEFSMVIGRK